MKEECELKHSVSGNEVYAKKQFAANFSSHNSGESLDPVPVSGRSSGAVVERRS